MEEPANILHATKAMKTLPRCNMIREYDEYEERLDKNIIEDISMNSGNTVPARRRCRIQIVVNNNTASWGSYPGISSSCRDL